MSHRGYVSHLMRDKLAELVVNNIPMDVAVKEAVDEWSVEDWKRVLDHDAFRTVCKEKALAEPNSSLVSEARKYAGKEKVERVVG